MRRGFLSGMITGGIIGATTGMYAYTKMSPKQRRMMKKRGKRMINGAENIMEMFHSMHSFK